MAKKKIYPGEIVLRKCLRETRRFARYLGGVDPYTVYLDLKGDLTYTALQAMTHHDAVTHFLPRWSQVLADQIQVKAIWDELAPMRTRDGISAQRMFEQLTGEQLLVWVVCEGRARIGLNTLNNGQAGRLFRTPAKNIEAIRRGYAEAIEGLAGRPAPGKIQNAQMGIIAQLEDIIGQTLEENEDE